MASKIQPSTRHVASINDLSVPEIETIFQTAQTLLSEQPDERYSFRIGRNSKLAQNCILASLFYEPSTRTRLSFESAMLRLGGGVISSADATTSSAAKGESLADTVRVIANYADVIVIRHPRDGAARLAADYSPVPVINGGDGSHEHPTQTLCDIFTLRRKSKNLKGLNVAIAGDLRGSRTVHSFVYALARFGAHIVPMPARGMELPSHVDQRLREEFKCDFDPSNGAIGALYRTPYESHEPTLFAAPEFEFTFKSYLDSVPEKRRNKAKIAAVYVTRFQKERRSETEPTESGNDYLTIDHNFLQDPKYSQASVLHPLPRIGEIDVAVDSDSRAVYFEQAAYGVPIRMALIALLLGLSKGRSLQRFPGGFEAASVPVYDQPFSLGIHCSNHNCIVHDPRERPYVRNKFFIVKKPSLGTRLRCMYCETDIEQFVVGHIKKRWYSADSSLLAKMGDLRDIIILHDQEDALAKGYHKRQSSSGRPARRAPARSAAHP